MTQSEFVAKIIKNVKTEQRYYIFMEFCNGGDLRLLMQAKRRIISPHIV